MVDLLIVCLSSLHIILRTQNYVAMVTSIPAQMDCEYIHIELTDEEIKLLDSICALFKSPDHFEENSHFTLQN